LGTNYGGKNRLYSKDKEKVHNYLTFDSLVIALT